MAVNYGLAFTRAFKSPKKALLDIGILILYGIGILSAYFAFLLIAGFNPSSDAAPNLSAAPFWIGYALYMVAAILIFARPFSYFTRVALGSSAKVPELPLWNGQEHFSRGLKQYFVYLLYSLVIGVVLIGLFLGLLGPSALQDYAGLTTAMMQNPLDSAGQEQLLANFFVNYFGKIMLFALLASIIAVIWSSVQIGAVLSSAQDGTFKAGFNLSRVFGVGFSKMFWHMLLAGIIVCGVYMVLALILMILFFLVIGFVLAPFVFLAFAYWASIFVATVIGQAYNDVVTAKSL